MKNLTSIAEHSDWLENRHNNSMTKWNLHRLRVEFGKQLLEIWMFVPCKLVDGVWEVLEEPLQKDVKYDCLNFKGEEDFDVKKWTADFVEYDEAKERCLFEGFEFDGTYVKSINYGFHIKYINKLIIENLVPHKPLLTPTAQKQIGL